MPVRLLLAVTFIVLCTVGLGYLLSDENTGQFLWFSDRQPQPVTVNNPDQPPSVSESAPQTPPPEPSDDALGFMLASAAQEYAQNIRYPQYSLPLTKARAEGYQGNRYQPVRLPLPGDGSFTVTLEKFRFVEDEDILRSGHGNGSASGVTAHDRHAGNSGQPQCG